MTYPHDRALCFLAVYIIFTRNDGQVLLLKRINTGFADGLFSLVAGHVDRGEFAVAAAVREAQEEAGVEIDPSDLNLIHVMHRECDDSRVYVDMYFRTNRWKGEIVNKEPSKCEILQWFSLDALPENILDYVKSALIMSLEGKLYSNW